MSFQDVGKRKTNRQPVNASMGPSSSMGMPSTSSASAAASGVFGSMSVSASTATSQISDSLTQYHVRNPLEDTILRDGRNTIPDRLICFRRNRMQLLGRNRFKSVLQESNLVKQTFRTTTDCVNLYMFTNGSFTHGFFFYNFVVKSISSFQFTAECRNSRKDCTGTSHQQWWAQQIGT